jgi:hypothetical protein
MGLIKCLVNKEYIFAELLFKKAQPFQHFQQQKLSSGVGHVAILCQTV